MRKISITTIVLLSVSAARLFAADNVDIDQLMSRMTLEEKIGQMNQLVGPKLTGTTANTKVDEKIKVSKVGSILNVKGAEIERLQRIAVEQTRLGIPILFGLDVIHGYETCFPIPLAMASSWNTDAVETASRIAGSEASREGIAWTFTPMCDICRDPRWGRIAEGAGEDPYLGGEIAAAQVRGFQGNLDKATDIAACVKHFALYGAPQAGRDYYTVDMSRVQMMNEYMWPYQAAINAGALTAMSSFNEFESLPITIHPYMLDTLLRDRMGFEGMLVTDYDAIKETLKHGAAANAFEASVKAANAGVDMDMVSESFSNNLAKAVREGLVSEETINRACRRVLEVKARLGLFSDPYKFNRPEESDLNGSAQNRAAARDIAAKSIVLLKNGKNILPLAEGRKIAVIGPMADQSLEMLGCWNIKPKKHTPVTLLEGLQNRFGKEKVAFARGCHILEDAALEKQASYHSDAERGRGIPAEKLRKEALALAKKSDVIVAAMGETALMSGEGSSRSDITIPEPQRSLLKELVATGKPVVLVLMAGRPLVLDWEDENVDAIVNAWHLGSEAGNAIADVLSGDVNPSGRLTATFPRNVGQVPIFYNHKNSGRPVNSFAKYKKYTSAYFDVVNAPLYPFGYGLSYGSISYSNLNLSCREFAAGDPLVASVTLENKSAFDITETVQIYIRDKAASITRPVKELRAYKQVLVKAGQTLSVEIPVDTRKIGFYGSDLKYVVEPGEFNLMAGPSSDSRSLLTTQFLITENNKEEEFHNPISKQWYADPEAIMYDGQCWIFPTWSRPYDDQIHFDAFSSHDFKTWKRHNNILTKDGCKWIRRALWAPAAIRHNGKYYLFFGANDIHEGEFGGIGVAVADKPEGPYTDAIGKPLIGNIINGAQPIDQCVFKDDDGTVYMYYGGWRHCNMARMNDSLTGFIPFEDGSTFKEVTPANYVEGPFMLKRGGKYYFMWSEGTWTKSDYKVAYAISDSPYGPFQRIATILEEDPEVGTGAGHHSVIKGKGDDEYYIVYHRHPLGSTDGNDRVVCIDRLYFDENGYILPVKMTK